VDPGYCSSLLHCCRAPARTCQVTELVRNRITPPGWSYQRCLVVYTQNSSCMMSNVHASSGHFGQVGYHCKLQDSAKMCAPLLKCHQLQGALPPWPPPGALPPEPPEAALP